MTYKTGASTTIALRVVNSAFGTAIAVGAAGDKLVLDSFDFNLNNQVLTTNMIGAGLEMLDGTDAGAVAPTGTTSGPARYNDATKAGVALFFAGNSVSTPFPTTGCQSFLYDANINQRFATIAWEECVGSIVEVACAFPVKYMVEAAPYTYLKESLDWVGNNLTFSGATSGPVNTSANLATATVADSQKVICKDTSTWQMNGQAGAALGAGDYFTCKKVTIEYKRLKEMSLEMKGSAGLSAPIPTGEPPFECDVTVEFSNEADFLWKLNFVNGTEYKAALTVTGPVISGSGTYLQQHVFPRLKVVEEPDMALAKAGVNPFTVKFKALVATANPTGMIHTYPYMRLQSTKTTAFLT